MTHRRSHISAAARTGGLAALLALLAAPPAGAQAESGARLQAWAGCWSAEQTMVPNVATIGPIVCVVPTADASVVEVATLQEGKVVSRERLDVSGRERPIEARGCTGTQRARWSSDRRRVYLTSAGRCEGLGRSTSGILAFTPSGEWLDVQGVTAGDGGTVRVARYRDVGIPRSVPAEISAALAGRDLATQSARIAAGAPVKIADVIESSRAVDSAVVEAWLLERGQQFALTGRDLVALADAGVPARVTDALVAVSNPREFALGHIDEDGVRTRGPDLIGGRGSPAIPDPYGGPWGWGYAAPYGYGGGYGGYYGYPGFYNPPVVIVRGGDGSHGRMVKGEGYRKGEGSATTTGATQTSQPATGKSDASTSKSPAPSTTTRTAKPRD